MILFQSFNNVVTVAVAPKYGNNRRPTNMKQINDVRYNEIPEFIYVTNSVSNVPIE